MKLNNLIKIKSKKKKIIGRGIGSGKGGHTVGRGAKGQSSRTGFRKLRSWIRESKIRSLPKLKGIGRRKTLGKEKKYTVINLKDIENLNPKTTVTKMYLKEKGLISNVNDEVKILGTGKVSFKIDPKGFLMSKSVKNQLDKSKK